MNDKDLYEIVKKYPDLWPKDVVLDSPEWGEPMFVMYGLPVHVAELMFESVFHRELQQRTYSVLTAMSKDSVRVTVQHHDFDAPTLIEAYAKALEWLE